MRVPFEWGVNDCALFTADAVEAITGTDLASECRGRYNSKETAAALLRELCGAGLEEYAALKAQQYGMAETDIWHAKRGDMVLYVQDTGPSLGIVSLDGMRALIAVEGKSIERTPVLKCSRAWRVG